MRLLHGKRGDGRIRHGVMLPGGADVLPGEERLDDGERFRHPRETHAARIEGKTEHLVIVRGGRATCADAEFETTAAEQIERRRLLGEHDGLR